MLYECELGFYDVLFVEVTARSFMNCNFPERSRELVNVITMVVALISCVRA